MTDSLETAAQEDGSVQDADLDGGVGVFSGEGDIGTPSAGDAFPGVEAQAGAIGIRRQSQAGDVWRRFRRNKLALVGLGMLAIVVILAIFAPLIAPDNPYTQNLLNTQASPSAAHLFGTDEVGRDQLSRVIYGTRIALLVGISSIVLAVVVGVILGAVAGYFGRAWDSIIMRIADIFFAFPLLVGSIVIITVVGEGVLPVIIAIGIFSWATIARLLRSSILSIREAEYVEAARSIGASRWRIVTRHILPNSFAPVLVYAAFNVGTAIVTEAVLSYLGIGVRPDVPEWGNMISAGQKYFNYKDYLWFFPSIAIVFTVLAFVFAGDGLRDALDPKLK